ncbi:MAG: DinB family protein [Nevskia sp.]
MIDREHARLMARYNQWMNAQVYDAAARLDDAQRREDRGAFFKSIHGTLAHLIDTDTAWLHGFTGRSLDGLSPNAALHGDFEAMRARRAELDAELLAWAATITPDWLAADFTYYSQISARHFTRPAWVLVTHLFNHETHHRGQITTLLTQLGLDVGATDLPLLPEFAGADSAPV